MKSWPAAIADACITDPPYGDTSLAWDKRCDGWLEGTSRILKPNASIWVFGSMRFLSTIFADMETAGFKYAQDIVWEKQNGTGFHNDRFRRVHEHAIQFYRGAWSEVYKDPPKTMDARAKVVRKKEKPAQWHGKTGSTTYVSVDGGPRLARSVIYCPNEHGHALHPTQKPLEILAQLIGYSVPAGGLVIDPFHGSGSTGIAAELLGRNWMAAEINPDYLRIKDERTRQSSLFAA